MYLESYTAVPVPNRYIFTLYYLNNMQTNMAQQREVASCEYREGYIVTTILYYPQEQ